MMKTAALFGYWVVEWSDEFDPSLADLLQHVPELVLGQRVAVASCDSGPFKPSTDDIENGWTVHGTIAISPTVQSILELPTPGFDEWYVYDGDPPTTHHVNFVNQFGFSPLDMTCEQTSKFWEQVRRVRPLHLLGAGTPTMFLVTRDESIYLRAANAVW